MKGIKGSLVLIGFLLASGCNFAVDIESESDKAPARKSKAAEMTAGSNRQVTADGYIVESQVGHPFDRTHSKVEDGSTVYHSSKIGSGAN